MEFWIFMLVTELFVPIVMVFFGKYFLKSAPKEINSLFGYRTTMSMKNKDTWIFAHKYCGRIWFIAGLIMLPVTLLVMLFVLGKSEDIIGTVGSVICIVQLIPMVGAIVPTEKALKRNFDEDGNRK